MDDKYPPAGGRRRFVKGVVGSATLTGVGTAAATTLNAATHPVSGSGGPTDYVGIETTDGPAPRAMPIVPLRVTDEGYLEGIWPETRERELEDGSTITVTEQEIGGVTYTGRWFQYCGAQTAEGLHPEADQDDFLRSKPGMYEWQADHEPGRKLRVDDFDDYEEWTNGIGSAGAGKPAQTTWRSVSEGDEDVQQLPVQILRSPKVSEMGAGSDHAAFVQAATESDFVAWLDKCTHFCCTPGFNATRDASKFGATDEVYCQCHQSVYDPLSPVEVSFNAFPRPD